MVESNRVPNASYEILPRGEANSTCNAVVAEIRNFGFTIVDAGFPPEESSGIAEAFDEAHKQNIA